ncbi:MAG: putative glycoside hydrolase [Patescibacteria group bacterium]|nr:putative glycoside hydrolase [Patescibacteria group bacterium]
MELERVKRGPRPSAVSGDRPAYAGLAGIEFLSPLFPAIPAIKFAVAILLVATSLLIPISDAGARLNVPSDKYVRSANYYLRAGSDIRAEHYPLLARYDLLVLPAEAQVYNRYMFSRLRELNPDITILAYVPSKSYNHAWGDSLHRDLANRIDSSWWLTDPDGQRISIWPGTEMLNTVSPWSRELPKFVSEEIWSTGLWDGIFYDEFSANISWVNGGWIDIHRDGQKDDPHLADVAWERATVNMLRETRTLLGPSAVIMTNGDSTASLQPFVNGRMFESFPTPWHGQGRWQDSVSSYLGLHLEVGYRPTFIINGNSGNSGNNTDYRKMRFTLASTLMGDGFFSYDFGEQDHGQLWWYDEQDAQLGEPIGPAMNQFSLDSADVVPGLWRRDFQNGVVFLNSTGQTQAVHFRAELEHLKGTQDPFTNDGSLTNAVAIPPNDGVILLKPVMRITGSAFPNGAFARIYNMKGQEVRNGFIANERGHNRSKQIIMEDLDGDGRTERIVAGATEVTVYGEDGRVRATFKPYGPDYFLGVNIAVGDLDGNGRKEIVTGASLGGGPHIRIFGRDGQLLSPGFFAFNFRLRGGVSVATADLYGTGRDVIIAGAGPGGGPHVRVFNGYGGIVSEFFAYDHRFRGGVRVAAGDLDGDGRAEIVTGAGPGGGPHVRVWNSWGRSLGGFFAGDPTTRGGVQVAVTDTDGDGVAEIAALIADIVQLTGY